MQQLAVLWQRCRRTNRGDPLFAGLFCQSQFRVHPCFYLEDVYRELPMVRQHASLLPLLRDACAEGEVADGTQPRMERMESALDYLRVLKDHPHPLIERMAR